MISDQGQPEYRLRGRQRPRRFEECGLASVAHCLTCERWVCSTHLYSRHYQRHPVIYPEA
jgi:hypothetical protein